jgi:hypothetical protein
VYLLHLATKNPIYDQQSGKITGGYIPILHLNSNEVVCWAEPDVAIRYIREGKVKPIGHRNSIQKLVWCDPKVQMFAIAEEMEGYKPSRERRTRYAYNWETDDNPKNVWTLKHLSSSTQPIFLAVASDCGGVTEKRIRRRR